MSIASVYTPLHLGSTLNSEFRCAACLLYYVSGQMCDGKVANAVSHSVLSLPDQCYVLYLFILFTQTVETINHFIDSMISPFPLCHIVRITQWTDYQDWLLSLNVCLGSLVSFAGSILNGIIWNGLMQSSYPVSN